MYAYLTYRGSSNELMTCVGHSLGAHICGMVSNHLTTKQHKIIGKNSIDHLSFGCVRFQHLIPGGFPLFYRLRTGLDPARPLIEQVASRDYRLTRDDAQIVQVMHTNAGTLGQISLTGSLDLCINGGRSQPFCRRGFRLSRNNRFWFDPGWAWARIHCFQFLIFLRRSESM